MPVSGGFTLTPNQTIKQSPLRWCAQYVIGYSALPPAATPSAMVCAAVDFSPAMRLRSIALLMRSSSRIVRLRSETRNMVIQFEGGFALSSRHRGQGLSGVGVRVS